MNKGAETELRLKRETSHIWSFVRSFDLCVSCACLSLTSPFVLLFSCNPAVQQIVYIAPMKSLVAEMTGNFAQRLKPYNLRVEELTGDANLTREQVCWTITPHTHTHTH